MQIKVIDLTFKNFLSYGNSTVTFSFERGMHLIHGKIGNGKSTILEALYFCFYGTPYRKIKINSLINRKNKKKLYTCGRFSDGKNEYKIVRTLAPASLKFFKNDQEQNTLPSKKQTQIEINRILGMNSEQFRQWVGLAVTKQKSYMTLSLPEKRELLEHNFNIKIVGLMNEHVKKELTSFRTDKRLNDKNIENVNDRLLLITSQIRQNKEVLKNFEQEKKKDIQELNLKISDISKEILDLSFKKDTLELDRDKHKIDDKEFLDNKKRLDNLKDERAEIVFFIKNKKEEYKNLRDLNKCSHCKQIVDEQHKNKELEIIKNIVLEKKEKKEKIDKVIEKLEEYVQRNNVSRETFNDINQQLKTLNYNTHNKEKEIIDLNDRIIKIKEKKIDFDLEKLAKQKKEIITEKKEYECKDKELIEKIDIREKSVEILSDTGIKKYFFDNLLPILNQKINGYLNIFEMPIKIEIGSDLNEKIWDISKNEIEFEGFSEGEKQRINLSILFSFIDLTKMINNWDSNLIIFDELLDSNSDNEDVDNKLICVKNIVEKEKNKSVYLISHRVSNPGIFDDIFKVEKKNGFSVISK